MSARRQPVEYSEATPEVREIFDDIMATRKTDWINNFWKVLAHDPRTLKRIWTKIKEVMGGAAARNKGMTEAQYSELLAIVGLANETNRLVIALDVAVDPQFL